MFVIHIQNNNIVDDKTGEIIVNTEQQYTIIKQKFQK